MSIQKILDLPVAVHIASFLGRVTPPGIGYSISETLGAWIAARRDSPLTRAVRSNQWMVRGASPAHGLDLAVRDTLKQNARDLYTLYHNLHRPEQLRDRIIMDPVVCEILDRPMFAKRGLVVAGLHLSIFDLVLQHILQGGLKAIILTLPNPRGGRRVEYERRQKTGANILPASLNTLRHTVKYLRSGGMVITGIDRPVPEPKYSPRFFGYRAALPTHHIWLALQTRVPVVVMAVMQSADGSYRVRSSRPIEMEPIANHSDAIVRNAERVLNQAEAFIRMVPQQWNVPLPVWPELPEAPPG